MSYSQTYLLLLSEIPTPPNTLQAQHLCLTFHFNERQWSNGKCRRYIINLSNKL